jgi:ferredoxin-thioredoxin reductase catalytic chain
VKRVIEISDAAVDALLQKLQREAEAGGYHLNPDREFARELVKSLLVNQERYGYWACPCRLAAGDKAADLDIVCPCDYRDADLNEFGSCFCALYVVQEIVEGKKQAASIPERRPPAGERRAAKAEAPSMRGGTAVGVAVSGKLSQPVWRCKVCGYLCARGDPPDVCPICKAKKDRFERFI